MGGRNEVVIFQRWLREGRGKDERRIGGQRVPEDPTDSSSLSLSLVSFCCRKEKEAGREIDAGSSLSVLSYFFLLLHTRQGQKLRMQQLNITNTSTSNAHIPFSTKEKMKKCKTNIFIRQTSERREMRK